MKTVSLFSGCGGLDLGFIQAGFDIIYANDFDKYAVESYKHNISDHIVHADITKLDVKDIPKHDILIGGFPCQPFSKLSYQQGFLDKTRGTLFFDVARIIKEHRPKLVVLENVRNLKNHDKGRTLEVIRSTLEAMDYTVKTQVLNSSSFSVPHNRNRIFIVCIRKDIAATMPTEFTYPIGKPLNTDEINLQSILETNVDSKYYLSHKILPTILSHGTGGYYSKSEIDLKIARPLTATMAKMHRANQDNYVTQSNLEAEASGKTNIRRLTPRECARLQGFPESYEIIVSDAQAYKQFGNAVTVNVAKSLATQLLFSIPGLTNRGDELFLSWDKCQTTADKKQLFSYVKETYEHLALEKPIIHPSEMSIINAFKLGFIDNPESFEPFLKEVSQNTSIDIEQFKLFLTALSHNNGTCEIPNICKTCRATLRDQGLNSKKPTLIDLFCGAGGMSLGFRQSGFHTLFANDIEPSCIETYIYNHPEVDPKNIVLGNITDFATTITQSLNKRSVDLIIGGPPCQSFSNGNRQRIIDDPRNHLYREYVKIVETTQPKFFVMENVVGMRKIASQVIEDFKQIGFEVEYKVLTASDFGVAQNRKRLIFIGNRLGVDNKKLFKEIEQLCTTVPNFTLYDAIADLPALKALQIKNSTEFESDENGYRIAVNSTNQVTPYQKLINIKDSSPLVYNHKARYNNERDIEIFSRLHQGDKSDDPKIADIMPYSSRNHIFKDKYFKLIYNQPCKTITAHMKFDCNMYIHPTQARGLTPREAARVQSYPDNYFFKGPFTKTYMQIGNSVPPLMARVIGDVIRTHVKIVQPNN